MVNSFYNSVMKKSYVVASDNKSEGHKYVSLTNAKAYNFIQFNAHAITTISIDIDDCDVYQLQEKLSVVPTPTSIVETDTGFHVHYLLTYPISYKRSTLVTWANHIRDTLIQLLNADVNAYSIKRLYRNPLKHSSAYTDVSYELKDFGIEYPYHQQAYKRSAKYSYDYNFSCVPKGSRHTSLFNYLRTKAYKLGRRDDIGEVLTFLAEEANKQLPTPLPYKEVENLVKSITTFMLYKYTGRKDQTLHNQMLAKAKKEKAISKITKSLATVSLKKAKQLSNRAIARKAEVSHSTVGIHKVYIFTILTTKTLSNIAQSLELYKEMNTMQYVFKCTDDKCIEKDKEKVIVIPLKDYHSRLEKLTCTSCGSKLQRVFSVGMMKSFEGIR